MNKFRLVVWSLNWVVAIVCGFIGILWYLDESRLYWLEQAEDQPIAGLILFIVALTTVLLNISYLVVRHVQGYPMRTHIPVRGADSSVTVSLHALRNALVRSLKREPEVHNVEVELVLPDAVAGHVRLVGALHRPLEGLEVVAVEVRFLQALRPLLDDRVVVLALLEVEVVLPVIRVP